MARSLLAPLALVMLTVAFDVGCGGGSHPTGIRLLGLVPGACSEGGTAVFGRVPLRIEPEGPGAFRSVEVRVISGGSLAPLSDKDAPFIVEIDTTKLKDGVSRLKVMATDTEGQELVREVDICVDNAGPHVSLLSPAPGASLGLEDAKLAVRISVDDPAGIASATARLLAPGAYQEASCDPPTAKEQVCILRPGELALPATQPGSKTELTLIVTARDKVGRERSIARKITVGTRLLWRFNAGASISWRAVVTQDGAVVVGTDGGMLHVVAADGQERCHVQLPLDPQGQPDPVQTPLTYATIAGVEHVFLATTNTLCSVDPTTCTLQWSQSGVGSFSTSRPLCVAAPDLLFISNYGLTSTPGALRAYRASTGAPLNALPISSNGTGGTGSPALSADGRTLYVGSSDSNLHAIDVTTPTALKERWKVSVGGTVDTLPLVTPHAVFVSAWTKTFHALDPNTGSSLSSFSFTAKAGFRSNPLLGPDHQIYVGSFDETLYAIDDRTGKVQSTFKLGRMVNTSPVLGPGQIVFAARTSPGRLYALSSKLDPIWSVQPGTEATDKFKATPAVAGNRLFIGSSNGFLYAFDATPPTQ